MKKLLEKNKKWEFAFGDVKEVTQDTHEDECPETEPETASNQQCILTTAEESDEECNLTEVLEALEEKEMINPEVKGKLTAIYKVIMIIANNKTTIPMYKKADEKQEKQKFKFIEIIHDDEPTFVRKTKFLLLFQEGERVLSDRLFCVRSTQPYNKTLQTITKHSRDFQLPKTDEQVSLRDLYVFQNKAIIGQCNQWKIERIIQSANYKERLKKINTTKIAQHWSSHRWELCVYGTTSQKQTTVYLYIHQNDDFSYISLGCFEEIKGIDIKETRISKLPAGYTLHTAQEMLINEEVLDFITINMAEIQEHEKVFSWDLSFQMTNLCTSKGNGNPTYGLSVMGIAYTIKTKSNYGMAKN